MKILGVVTARGGSKGVPRKNIVPLLGKPLIAYTAEAMLASERLHRRILSTDDEEIASIGAECGLEVPFLRPPELARDDTPTVPVLQHAVSWVHSQGEAYDAVCLLQPTNPFRRPEDIDGCIEMLERTGADAVVTVLPVPDRFNPHWVFENDDRGYLRLSTGESRPVPRRQELPRTFHREGSVYVTRTQVLMEQNSLYGDRLMGYLMDGSRCVNIDEISDLETATRMGSALLPSSGLKAC